MSTAFQFEDNLVNATVTAFNADVTLGDIAYGPREKTGLPKSRIDVEALGFSKASEQQVFAAGRHWDSHYSGTLSVTVITQRAAAAAANHATRVGRVRYLMNPKAALFTSSNLPSYEVLAIDHTGTTTDYDQDTDTDRTEMEFTVHLAVLASALS